MKKQTLNGIWLMKECSSDKNEMNITVPGSVLSGLLENHAIEDPYYRDNEYAARELFWKDYEFERTFVVTEELLQETKVELVCYGLDTLTEIYVNNELLAETNNMHRTYRIDVKNMLKVGENNIRILFKSTLQYIKDYKYEENKKIKFVSCGVMEGNQLIRKAHSMFGWDWGAQLPDAGIFRDIELEAYSEAAFEDIRIDQLHSENTVKLSLHTKLQMLEEKAYMIQVRALNPEGEVISNESSQAKQADTLQELTIHNPKLWWPNGFGEQPLYTIQIELLSDERVIDQKEYTIGLRTLTVSQEKDEWGSEFSFQINGVKIFTKGANYIPEDCIYSRITAERIEYLVKSSVRANYNCLRVWGGGYYPSDMFYQLCDQYGLIVWQDLMYACNVYDVTEEFEESIVKETIDNIKRLRHHACLGMWCGNNEIESAWRNWGGFQEESDYLRADYVKQFEYLLPKAVKQTDNTTFFWPSSPSSGGCFDDPDSENRGDTHYWSVWHGLLPFSDYQNHYFRFCSEFGFQSFPSLKTVETFTKEEDRNIFSRVMESHQKNDAANGKILYYLSENFYYPKDFDNLLYVSQILQGVAIKSGVEHFRRNRGRCMGSLYWQINDNWPVASWSSIDYFGRWKALHYMAKNFYAPIAASLVRHENEIEVHIQNESLQDTTVKAILTLKNMQLETLAKKELTTDIKIEALTAKKIAEVNYTDILQDLKKSTVFVELQVIYADGTTQVETETFEPYKHMQLPKAHITKEVVETEEGFEIILQTDVFANYVELNFANADAVFSDNYFALTGMSKKVFLQKEDITNGTFQNAAEVAEALQIRSIRDSYTF